MNETAALVVWGIGLAVWIAIRLPRRRKAQRTKVVVDGKSTGEKIALALCIVGLAIVPLVHSFTSLFEPANYPFSPFLGWIGALSMLAFLILFYQSHKLLARNWSVTLELREGHELVVDGLYRYMRHPMYTSFWLWGLAQLFLIPNWIAGPAGLASVAWLFFSRINKEEAMMRGQFGQAYDDYCDRTARLIPGIY